MQKTKNGENSGLATRTTSPFNILETIFEKSDKKSHHHNFNGFSDRTLYESAVRAVKRFLSKHPLTFLRVYLESEKIHVDYFYTGEEVMTIEVEHPLATALIIVAKLLNEHSREDAYTGINRDPSYNEYVFERDKDGNISATCDDVKHPVGNIGDFLELILGIYEFILEDELVMAFFYEED